MLSKLITYGQSREEAISLMIKAIADYRVKGVETTLAFGDFVCRHEAFRSGNFDTHFVKKFYAPKTIKSAAETEAKVAALTALYQYLEDQKQLRIPQS